MDYRALLMKYMEAVRTGEGDAMRYVHTEDKYDGGQDWPGSVTAEEAAEMERLDAEITDKVNASQPEPMRFRPLTSEEKAKLFMGEEVVLVRI